MTNEMTQKVFSDVMCDLGFHGYRTAKCDCGECPNWVVFDNIDTEIAEFKLVPSKIKSGGKKVDGWKAFSVGGENGEDEHEIGDGVDLWDALLSVVIFMVQMRADFVKDNVEAEANLSLN